MNSSTTAQPPRTTTLQSALLSLAWLCIICLAAGCGGPGGSGSATPVPPEQVVAYVGDTPIQRIEHSRSVQARLKDLRERNPTTVLTRERIQAIHESSLIMLIQRELLFQSARRAGVAVTPEELNTRLDQIRTQVGGPEGYQRMLQTINQSEREFITQVVEKDLTVQKFLIERVTKQIRVAEEEIRSAYEAKKTIPEQVRARHLVRLITPDMNASRIEMVKQEVESYRMAVENGGDFAEIARLNSHCPSAADGGDVGFFGYAQMVPEFSQVAFSLDLNMVSTVFRSPYGFHILKTTGRRPSRIATQEELRDEIMRQISLEKGEQRTQEILADISRQVPVKINDPNLAGVGQRFLQPSQHDGGPQPAMPIGGR